MSADIDPTRNFGAARSERVSRLTNCAVVTLLSLTLWAVIIGGFIELWR
jgi:hypothetical protein